LAFRPASDIGPLKISDRQLESVQRRWEKSRSTDEPMTEKSQPNPYFQSMPFDIEFALQLFATQLRA